MLLAGAREPRREDAVAQRAIDRAAPRCHRPWPWTIESGTHSGPPVADNRPMAAAMQRIPRAATVERLRSRHRTDPMAPAARSEERRVGKEFLWCMMSGKYDK